MDVMFAYIHASAHVQSRDRVGERESKKYLGFTNAFLFFIFGTQSPLFLQVFSRQLTDEQIDAIMDALDTDGDGTLSYAEFLEGFSVVDTSKATPASSAQSSPQATPPATP